MHPQALEQHQWLHKLRGEWACETTALKGSGEQPDSARGHETVRSLGELWVVCGAQIDLPGGGTTDTLMTLGFDPVQERFVGTWVGSMLPWLWNYSGTLDASRKVLTLDTQGPSLSAPETLAHYRDVIEWLDDDHRVHTSHLRGPDGRWTTLMISHYRRTDRRNEETLQ